ncbi:hypothetical protein B0H14DRAFT_3872306 [Mycena olivaceomarginata]|nr:hypothetical protein B0H14DRAFT_3872306 [Mycena olivaceomarginata]
MAISTNNVPRIHSIIETAMRNGLLTAQKALLDWSWIWESSYIDSELALCSVPNTALRGVTIMMDECALEEQAVYFSHANKVGDDCNALGDGKVHFGKEMLFVAAKCRGESTLYPLLCAPTCKQGTWEDSKALFNLLIDVWGEEAAEIVGQIDTFASVGDHLRRKAGHTVFMQFELKSVYVVLSNLPDLNLFTGPGMMLMTFDWRHVLKTMHTLASYIGRIVNPACLQRCLLLLPGQTDASVYTLLNPDDPQDVQRVILLLEAVVALRVRRVEFNVSPLDVDTNSDLDTITLLSLMLEAILNAFTDPSASLSDQIRNLSIYAHMSFVLFQNFRLKVMSNQLYGDSQTMVKNIVFTVAKQIELDPTGEVNAYHDGTDPVEDHFAFTREIGGHNSAMNFKQGVERSGWSCDIQGVHSRNPGLHAGHRRSNITRAEIKDHLNEYNFTGDYVVGHCDLVSSWRGGCIETMRIFKLYSKMSPDNTTFPRSLLRNQASI